MSTTASERSKQQQGGVAQRYASMSLQEFGQEIQKEIQSLTKVTEAVTELVEAGSMQPLQALQIAACTGGALLDYEAFHPRSGVPWNQQGQQQNIVSGSDRR